MNTWQDLKVENPVIRPINIKKWSFTGDKIAYIRSGDSLHVKAELIDADGSRIVTPNTPVTGLESGTYMVPSATKFEMRDEFGMEFGVGVIFEVKKIDWTLSET